MVSPYFLLISFTTVSFKQNTRHSNSNYAKLDNGKSDHSNSDHIKITCDKSFWCLQILKPDTCYQNPRTISAASVNLINLDLTKTLKNAKGGGSRL